MKIYNYDAQGAFVSEAEADESPLEPGVFLIPADATDVAPPAFGANQIPVFDGTTWTVVPDYRGQVFYDEHGTRFGISQINVSPEPNWTTTEPPQPPGETEQERINRISRQYLDATDWYIVRKAETGVDVPADVTAQRQTAREAITG